MMGILWRTMADYGGFCRDCGGFCRGSACHSIECLVSAVAENGGFCRDCDGIIAGFCRDMAWQGVAEYGGFCRECDGIMAVFVDEYPLYLPFSATHFLIAFLSALCVLCGKKSLPRFMADWRIMTRHAVAENGGLWRKMSGMWRILSRFCLSFSLNALSRLWRKMAVFVGNVADYDAAWRGGKWRKMSGLWRILSTNILYIYHSPRRIF